VCWDPFQAEPDVVTHVAVVAVGEQSPWQHADVAVTQRKSLKVDGGVPVVAVLEDGEEVLRLVTGDRDVS
jgi:hypothetical protein